MVAPPTSSTVVSTRLTELAKLTGPLLEFMTQSRIDQALPVFEEVLTTL